MPADTNTWRVEPDATDAAASAVLHADPLWSGYSIADLEPPFRAYSRFALAAHGDAPPTAAVLVLRHPAFNCLITHGDSAGVAAILTVVGPDLAATSDLLVRESHLAAVARWYDCPAGWKAMCRMAVGPATFRPAARTALVLDRLGMADVAALRDLYVEYPDSAFNADQLASGIFYGVRDGERLLAAGGTHVSAARYGIAAIGNIYCRPEARGRGYATAITSAVTADLLAAGYRDVILNVAAGNVAARIYAGLGYREHCRYREARGVRRGDQWRASGA